MKKIKSILSQHKIMAVFLAILVVFGLTYASVTLAKSKAKATSCLWYLSYTYYSDASKTTAVGGRVYYCDGSVGHYGSTTAYFTEADCDCIVE